MDPTRAAGFAFCSVFSFFANLVSIYFFPQSDGPPYLTAMLIHGAFSASTIACVLFGKWLLVRENRNLKETAEREGTIYVPFTTQTHSSRNYGLSPSQVDPRSGRVPWHTFLRPLNGPTRPAVWGVIL